MSYARPLPHITAATKPFWDATHNGQLTVQQCGSCRKLRFPPATICDNCLSGQAAWVPVSGRGTVWSLCEFHRPYFKGFELPYNVALVRLAEGPRMYTNIVGIPPEEIRIDMRVKAVFEAVTDAVTLVKFTPDR
jgi:uncharacterized OB-fold protein